MMVFPRQQVPVWAAQVGTSDPLPETPLSSRRIQQLIPQQLLQLCRCTVFGEARLDERLACSTSSRPAGRRLCQDLAPLFQRASSAAIDISFPMLFNLLRCCLFLLGLAASSLLLGSSATTTSFSAALLFLMRAMMSSRPAAPATAPR